MKRQKARESESRDKERESESRDKEREAESRDKERDGTLFFLSPLGFGPLKVIYMKHWNLREGGGAVR